MRLETAAPTTTNGAANAPSKILTAIGTAVPIADNTRCDAPSRRSPTSSAAADKPMRDAILTLYHDDPISDRQRPRVAPADEIRTASVDLSVEIALLDQIDARLGRR